MDASWLYIIGGILIGGSIGWHGHRSPALWAGLIGFVVVATAYHLK